MYEFIFICVLVLAAVGFIASIEFVFDIITSYWRRRNYGKINTESIFINGVETLRNLLNEEIEKNNELITENRRLETEMYKLVQELNKHS